MMTLTVPFLYSRDGIDCSAVHSLKHKCPTTASIDIDISYKREHQGSELTHLVQGHRLRLWLSPDPGFLGSAAHAADSLHRVVLRMSSLLCAVSAEPGPCRSGYREQLSSPLPFACEWSEGKFREAEELAQS